jgi:hypothetical protein
MAGQLKRSDRVAAFTTPLGNDVLVLINVLNGVAPINGTVSILIPV